ncbi:unnamed protein product [Periconia digitata]|uniref:Uncharacterized protein n=1 Tax=Periconia digitata TaxID=1303443 RepID=A0A9W4XPC0_9PLEO|nr:unnamed protein product [Periconia digitata]
MPVSPRPLSLTRPRVEKDDAKLDLKSEHAQRLEPASITSTLLHQLLRTLITLLSLLPVRVYTIFPSPISHAFLSSNPNELRLSDLAALKIGSILVLTGLITLQYPCSCSCMGNTCEQYGNCRNSSCSRELCCRFERFVASFPSCRCSRKVHSPRKPYCCVNSIWILTSVSHL